MRTILREKQWQIKAPNEVLQEQFVTGLDISPVIAQILINRNIQSLDSAKSFVSKDIDSIHDPFLFQDMDKITNRIIKAINNKEKITVYGDYDADGLCSTALLIRVLCDLYANCRYYLPNRFEEGYGLNKEAIHKCHEDGTKLLITVDCGISSIEEIDFANSLGMETIITDHHTPSDNIPKCLGVLNPKIDDSNYPFCDLAGVGVVYKLVQAIAKKTNLPNINQHLDLVALGTIADIVPITGENRILVHYGLQTLKETNKIGIQKLKERVKLSNDIQTGHVAFRLAPRLNASGRLKSAENSIKLLLSNDETESLKLAKILDAENYERQRLEQEVLKSALEQVELKFNFNTDKVIVIENRNWPAGVIGIVASRLVNQYHRPAIVITVEDGLGKGSGRSIKNFNLLESLNACKDYFKKFGGHVYAAGIQIEELLIPSFREKINEYADTVLTQKDLIPTLEIDLNLSFRDITFELIDKLQELAPFGYSNPKPLFLSQNLQVYRGPEIVGKDHLKVWFKSEGKILEAIGFGMAEWIDHFDEFRTVDLVHRLTINTWHDKQTIQLQIQDMKLN